MARAQVWSMDLIVAVVIFLLAIGVFYYFADAGSEEERSILLVESQLIAEQLNEEEGIAAGTAIEEARLKRLVYEEYAKLKERYGVQGEFCIIIRDQEGNVVALGNQTAQYKVGIGSEQLELDFPSGQASCGELLTEEELAALG